MVNLLQLNVLILSVIVVVRGDDTTKCQACKELVEGILKVRFVATIT